MSGNASPYEILTVLDKATSAIKVLGERVQTLESRINRDRVEFLAFRSSVERGLALETRLREERARVSSPPDVLAVVEKQAPALEILNLNLREPSPAESSSDETDPSLGHESPCDPQARPTSPDTLSVEANSVHSGPRTPPRSKPCRSKPAATKHSRETTTRYALGSFVRIVGGKNPKQYTGKTFQIVRHCGSLYSLLSDIDYPDNKGIKRANASLAIVTYRE